MSLKNFDPLRQFIITLTFSFSLKTLFISGVYKLNLIYNILIYYTLNTNDIYS